MDMLLARRVQHMDELLSAQHLDGQDSGVCGACFDMRQSAIHSIWYGSNFKLCDDVRWNQANIPTHFKLEQLNSMNFVKH